MSNSRIIFLWEVRELILSANTKSIVRKDPDIVEGR